MRHAAFALLTLLCALLPAGCSHRAGAQRAGEARGAAVFAQQCAACHGRDGAGGPVGPALTRERARRSLAQIRAAIADPVPPMPKLYPSVLSQTQLNDVTAYVESL